MLKNQTYDKKWDELYTHGFDQRAPWDIVVSFLFRNAPKDKPRSEVKILEVGCGMASNLFFAAQQGFSVTGIDAAVPAILTARERFREAGLTACLEIGDFTKLPFDDASFDLVIDRGAICYTSVEGAKKCSSEISRVIKKGGRFFFSPYSDRSSSAASGTKLDSNTTPPSHSVPGGLRVDVTEGTLSGTGQIRFYGLSEVLSFLPGDIWNLLQVQHMEYFDYLQPYRNIHAEFRAIAEKW